ncbi:MAG TPA: N-acetylmuramoyl-L-alanine amidase [Epulopiscium sp.]|nr:N-acetylmuramoyl-L-alanine amidase [Candidatus Epulonipiscium sp.]
MIRLCFDYGHGGRDPGARYVGRKESDDVLSVGQAVASYLRQQGVSIDETRTRDESVDLCKRGQFENKSKYDYFISFHRNAYRPEVGTGAETYVYLTGSPKACNLAKGIQKALAGLGFKDRGVKRANFYVLRNTRAPAILIEIGFIDNTADNKLFDQKRQEIVKALGEAIFLGIK